MNIYKYIALFGGTFAFGMTGCTQDTMQTGISDDKSLIIRGNSYSDFYSISSRSTDNKLKNGDKILLYSTGGLKAEAEELTYENGIWHQTTMPKWSEQTDDAEIRVYHPSENIKSNNLYLENGELIDVLYDYQKVTYKNNINLSFRHFFAKLNFIIDKSLNNKIEHIELTPSVGIDHIDLTTASSVYSDKKTKTIRITRQDNCNYSLIIPTDKKLSIGITLVTASGNKTATVSERTYERGTLYQCNIKEEKSGIGIFTAADFIAFTQLINGNSYENRSLDEFREENKDGTYTYYLKNDIVLTDEDNDQIQLGKSDNDIFSDVFDGMNHTISNLKIIPNSSTAIRTALFINNQGTIKNLTLSNAAGTFSSKYYLSLLVAYNKGLIDNCHIKDATIAVTMNEKDKSTAGIATNNIGTIINSSCDGISIKVNKKDKNTIAGIMVTNHNSKNGRILNCYVCNSSSTNTGPTGGFCARMQNGSTLENCYESNITFKNTGTKGTLLGNNSSSTVKNCFYEYGQKPIGNQSTDSDNYAYTATVTDPTTTIPTTEVVSRLNEWITTIGHSTYNEYQFSGWNTGESIPAIFINERKQ